MIILLCGADLETNLEDNRNRSKKEKEKAEDMIEIVGDTEAGSEDKTEDEDKSEDRPEDTLALAMKLLAKMERMDAVLDAQLAAKDIGNKAEDTLQPCTSAITENAADALQPIRTVRVPAHQISDRKFVTVGRKSRKLKEYRTDCKPS